MFVLLFSISRSPVSSVFVAAKLSSAIVMVSIMLDSLEKYRAEYVPDHL